MEHEKQEVGYEKPQVEDYGDLTQLTQVQLTGLDFDIPFPMVSIFNNS